MQSQMVMQWHHYENSDKDKRLRKEKFLRRSTLNELKAYIKEKHRIGTIAQPLLKFYESMSIDKKDLNALLDVLEDETQKFTEKQIEDHHLFLVRLFALTYSIAIPFIKIYEAQKTKEIMY